MATADANIGTLLFHLNELRHPTRYEARLLQISDEYLLLKESISKKKTPSSARRGKVSIEDLVEHLTEELKSNLVPLPDAPAFGSSAHFGTELLAKQIPAIVEKLKHVDPHKQRKAIRLLDTLATNETAVQYFVDAQGGDQIVQLLLSSGTSPIERDILHIVACLSAFDSFRSHQVAESVLDFTVERINAKNRDMNANMDLVLWILSNFCTDLPRQFKLGQRVMASLIDLMSSPKTEVTQQAIRCVTSLTVARANRKVVDAWEGFQKIVQLLDSPSADIALAATWALGHMASQECESLFDQSLPVIRRIARIITTPNVSNEQRSVACRCVANFALLPKARPVVLQEDTFSGLQTIIQELSSGSGEDSAIEASLLDEATSAMSRLLGKEPSLAESLSTKTLQTVVSLLTSPSSTVVSNCAWCLAYAARNEKLHTKIDLSGGLEATVTLLAKTQQPSEQLPAAWTLAKFATNVEYHDRIRDFDGLLPLAKCLFSKEQDIRLAAGYALFYASTNAKNKIHIKNMFSRLSLKDNVIEQRLKTHSNH